MNNDEKKQFLRKYQPTLDIRKLAGFITNHPGLTMFLVYGLIAIAGFIYLLSFYRFFDLDVIVYLELADILTAGIKDPMVMLMVFGAFSVVAFIWLMTYIAAPFNAWLDKKFSKGFFKFLPRLVGMSSTKTFWKSAVLVLIVYFVVFILIHSRNKAELIKQEKTNLIHIESDSNLNDTHEYSLLGTSINYIFLYDHNDQETLILPLESIKLLKPVHNNKEQQ